MPVRIMWLMRTRHLRWTVGATLAIAAAACARGGGKPAAPPKPVEPPITDGRSLVAAMHRRYDGKWYRTLSFVQNNTLIATTGRQTRSQWIEHVSVPGRLRIDYLPLSTKSGVLYDGGKVHVFDNGRVMSSQPGVNVYLLLTADVYAQPDSVTARRLAAEGFDLARIRRDSWGGQPAWVVGAAAGDSTSNQFWVSSDRLLLLRVVQRERRGARTIVTEARFDGYQDVGGVPIAHEIQLRRDGRLYFTEQYADVKVDPTLEPGLFDPGRWLMMQPKM